ncbi:MAG: hypothetical protein AB8B91_08230 [Rubripirellula sp.]
MSNATLSPIFIADSLADLSVLPDSTEWLALASKDEPKVIDCLLESLEGREAALASIPAADYDVTSRLFQAAVQKALQSSSVSHILLVDTSRYEQGLPTESEEVLPEKAGDVANRLMAGAVSQSACNQTSQQRFKHEVKQFLESPSIKPLWDDRSIAVCGLLYRQCDGLFLLFDPDSDKYTPLASTF